MLYSHTAKEGANASYIVVTYLYPQVATPVTPTAQTCGNSAFVSDKSQAQPPDILCRDADSTKLYFNPARFNYKCPGGTCTASHCCHASHGAPSTAKLSNAMKIATVQLSTDLGAADPNRVYASARHDRFVIYLLTFSLICSHLLSSVDLLWTASSGKATWTQLRYSNGRDSRKKPDITLDADTDRKGAHGFVPLPGGGMAAVRTGVAGGSGGPQNDKFLAEYDNTGMHHL